jgi:hypothetical protein
VNGWVLRPAVAGPWDPMESRRGVASLVITRDWRSTVPGPRGERIAGQSGGTFAAGRRKSPGSFLQLGASCDGVHEPRKSGCHGFDPRLVAGGLAMKHRGTVPSP